MGKISKKIITLAIVLVLVVSMFMGCSNSCKHEYEWTIVEQPTCETDGKMKGVCSKCSEENEDVIKALGHDYVDGVCTRCNKNKDKVYLKEGESLGFTVDALNEKANKLGYEGKYAALTYMTSSVFRSPYVNKLGMLKADVIRGINQYKVNFGFISEKYEISEDGAKTIYELKFTTNLTVVYEGGEVVNIGRVRGLGIDEQENDIVSLAVNKENLFLAIRSTREVEVVGKIAQDPDEIDQTSLLFKRSGDNYIVGGNIDLTASEIVIPEKFNGKPVTRIIAAAFYDMDNLTTVTIPKSVTFISKTAFSGCNKMKTINYCGTQAEWQTVVETSGHDFTGITVNYNCQ